MLDEPIVVLTSAVIDTDWQPASALAAVFGFAIAACLWWLYFDRVDEEAISQSFTGGVAGVVRSHVWGYGHLAVWAAIVTASVGIEFAIVATSEPALDLGVRVAVCGGVALYLVAVSAIQLATPSSLRRGVLVARLLVVAFALALVWTGPGPLGLVGLLALATIGLTVSEARYRGSAGGSQGPP